VAIMRSVKRRNRMEQRRIGQQNMLRRNTRKENKSK
jgi:hypothetical protein